MVFRDLPFSDRLRVAMPEEFGMAVRTAAERHGVTIADYARLALSERLERDGVSFPHLGSVNQIQRGLS